MDPRDAKKAHRITRHREQELESVKAYTLCEGFEFRVDTAMAERLNAPFSVRKFLSPFGVKLPIRTFYPESDFLIAAERTQRGLDNGMIQANENVRATLASLIGYLADMARKDFQPCRENIREHYDIRDRNIQRQEFGSGSILEVPPIRPGCLPDTTRKAPKPAA